MRKGERGEEESGDRKARVCAVSCRRYSDSRMLHGCYLLFTDREYLSSFCAKTAEMLGEIAAFKDAIGNWSREDPDKKPKRKGATCLFLFLSSTLPACPPVST